MLFWFLPLSSVNWFQIMKSEVLRVTHELQAMKDKIKENSEKIKVNKTLPYLVSNVIEVSAFLEQGEKRTPFVSGGRRDREPIGDWRHGVLSDCLWSWSQVPHFSDGFICDLEVLITCPLHVRVISWGGISWVSVLNTAIGGDTASLSIDLSMWNIAEWLKSNGSATCTSVHYCQLCKKTSSAVKITVIRRL